MFNINLLKRRRFGKKEREYKATVDKTGEYSMYFKNPLGGPWVQRVEEELAKYHNMKYAVACSNGTTALQLALECVLIEKYGADYRKNAFHPKICTTPYSFIATASAILEAGAEPVFIDVDPVTGTIPADRYRGRDIPRDCRIILPVHLLGVPADMRSISESQSWDYIIEDNAQGIGATNNGRLCGTFGDLSTYSFQYTKTITTDGEGGAVLTDNTAFHEMLLQLRSHGSQYKDSPFLTHNFRMTETQAAFGVAQLNKLGRFLNTQSVNARWIRSHLPSGLEAPVIKEWHQPSYFLIPLIFNERDAGMSRGEFIYRCMKKGVDQGVPGASVGLGYQTPLYDKPLLKPYKPAEPLLNVESLMQSAVWLDLHRWRTLDEVKREMEIIKEILEK